MKVNISQIAFILSLVIYALAATSKRAPATAAKPPSAATPKPATGGNPPPADLTAPEQPPVPALNATSTGDEAAVQVSRIILNLGLSECVLDELKETTASMQIENHAITSIRTVPHPPEIASEGQARFAVKFTSSNPKFAVKLLKSWNLDKPKVVGNTTFSFVEADLGNAPGATFIFYGIESCINGVMTPPVNVDVKASLNGANIPIKAIN
jgi:hypothetical protein